MLARSAFFILMNICDLKRGGNAVVLRVELDEELRARLASLGIYTGAKLKLLKASPLRHTYLVLAGSTRTALSKEVAKGVRIWTI